MTSTPCASEALDRLVEPWAAKIAKSSGTTVEAIVANAENVHAALQELKPHRQKARQLLAARSGLSRPMMSKLETIGRHAKLLRRRAGFLPPSVSSLYALARKPSPGFEQALMMDLRGTSCAEIKALFAPPSPPKPTRKLMTILVPPDLDEAARCLLIADIGAALALIAENRRVDLEVSSPASIPKIAQEIEASKASSTPSQAPPPQDQPQVEQPAMRSNDERRRAMSDAGRGARDMQQHQPDKVAIAGERNEGRVGRAAHNAHNQSFAAKPLGIDGRIMGSLLTLRSSQGETQLEADQRLIRERIERLEEAARLRRGPNGSTAPEAQRRAPPA